MWGHGITLDIAFHLFILSSQLDRNTMDIIRLIPSMISSDAAERQQQNAAAVYPASPSVNIDATGKHYASLMYIHMSAAASAKRLGSKRRVLIYQSPITPLSPNTLYMHLHNLLGDKLTMYQLPFYMINAPSSTGDRFMVQTGRGSGLRPWTCNPRVTYLTMRYSHWLSTRRSSLRVLLLALPCVYLKDELRREEARCRLTPRYQQN